MGVTKREEALAHFGIRSDYDPEAIIQAIEDDDDDTLEHFGVKGMKWGLVKSKVSGHFEAKAKEKARLDKPHPDYNPGMRRHDKLRFNESATKRINRSMNRGKSHREAVKIEQTHRKRVAWSIAGAAMAIHLIDQLGPLAMSEISRKASTNRDKRAQATEDFIRNGPQKPKTKEAKKNFRGVYNVTTM